MTVTTQIYSKCKVPAKSGTTVHIHVNQPVSYNGGDVLDLQGSQDVLVAVDGPRVQLNDDDIVGVYPAPGSEESADEFLPHIALTRRTLPWERFGVDTDVDNGVNQFEKPWLALVVFSESELKLPTPSDPTPKGQPQPTLVSAIAAKDPTGGPIISAKLGATAQVTVLYVRNDLWAKTRPTAGDLRFLSHIRSTTFGLKTVYTSTCICNRLPNAGAGDQPAEMHTACLVSLEGRTDLLPRPSNTTGFTALVVLHHWKFRPSKGGDFEQVMRAIRLKPNGGVLRFGNVTQASASPPLSGGFDAVVNPDGFFIDPLPHTQEGDVTWRSPLRPFQPPARGDGFAVRAAPEEFSGQQPGTPLDYSHATAFELGRLLALSNPGILEDLRNITAIVPEIVAPPAINNMPKAIQWPDWVTNPADKWYEQPWERQGQNMLKDEIALLEGTKPGDIGGINELPGQWGSDPLIDLGALPGAQIPVVVAIDVNTVSVQTLGQMFVEVESVAHGG